MTKSINWFLTLSSTIFFGHSLEPFLDRDEGGKSTKPLFDPSSKLHGWECLLLTTLTFLGLLNDPKKNLAAVSLSAKSNDLKSSVKYLVSNLK